MVNNNIAVRRDIERCEDAMNKGKRDSTFIIYFHFHILCTNNPDARREPDGDAKRIQNTQRI